MGKRHHLFPKNEIVFRIGYEKSFPMRFFILSMTLVVRVKLYNTLAAAKYNQNSKERIYYHEK